jgi:hypothetical protein
VCTSTFSTAVTFDPSGVEPVDPGGIVGAGLHAGPSVSLTYFAREHLLAADWTGVPEEHDEFRRTELLFRLCRGRAMAEYGVSWDGLRCFNRAEKSSREINS